MDQVSWVTEYGIWGLGVVAFLGATLVPVSSEIAVVAALRMGMPAWEVLMGASIGNALGASLNYVLGWLFAGRIEDGLGKSRGGRSALRWMHRYGKWSLLGSWLPVVGDPLCLAAGLFRIRLAFFVLAGIGTRIARYAVLIHVF